LCATVAAAAGRAKIRARINESMKVAARAPQAYRHARRLQAPTCDSPTLKRMGTFPSTERKPRQALRYAAMTPIVGYASVTLLAPRGMREIDLGEQETAATPVRSGTGRKYIVPNPQ
jgi:hypothetical protein